MGELEDLHAEEYRAFCEYGRAQRGDDGPTKHSAISPARVREKREAWHQALEAIKAAGYTRDDVRAMLRARGAEERKVKR